MSQLNAQQLLDVARGELGTVETYPNQVKYNDWYYDRRVSGTNYAWCAVFVSWVAAVAGATDIIPRTAWTPSLAQYYKERGRWGSSPRVGAVSLYNISGLGRISHCGFVEAVHPDGSFTAIEGNTDYAGGRTGGRVMRQTRRYVGPGGGFGYPLYGDGLGEDVLPSRIPNNVGDAGGQPLLRVGSRGEAVKTVQRAVGASADGIFGPKTRSAVQQFQRAHGLEPDGVVGPNTWGAINGASKPPAPPTAAGPFLPYGFPLPSGHWFGPVSSDKRNHSGYWAADRPHIVTLLNGLRNRGWRSVPVTDRYTSDVQGLIKRYQQDSGIQVDGATGPQTWESIRTSPIR